MKFCSACGHEVHTAIPDGDHLPRFVCAACETVHYQNPRMIVGTLPVWENKVLLCKRAIEPRSGRWTLPAGFMENAESVEEGALRETDEEAGANISEPKLFSLFSVSHVNQVYIIYLAQLTDLEFNPNFETAEIRLFGKDEIPWAEIAFQAVRFSLRAWVADEAPGTNVHVGEYDFNDEFSGGTHIL